MISSLLQKVKTYWEVLHEELFFVAIIMAVALISFGLGRLSVVSARPAIRLNTPPTISMGEPAVERQEGAVGVGAETTGRNYVASKNGTKYYALWCSGVNRIKEENKIWFASPEEAERAGYGKAANCDGL